MLSQAPLSYDNRARADLITDAPWSLDDPYVPRFSKDDAGNEYFYTRDGLLEGLAGALLTGYKDQFSQEVWFRTTEPGVLFTYTRPGGLLNRPMSSYRLHVRTDGRLEYALRDRGILRPVVDSVISPIAVNDGQWHQAVTTFNCADHAMELYVDGELVASQISAVTPEVPGPVSGLLGVCSPVGSAVTAVTSMSVGYTSGLNTARASKFAGDNRLRRRLRGGASGGRDQKPRHRGVALTGEILELTLLVVLAV